MVEYCGCLFVAKLSWKKRGFFEKIFVFFTKYTLFEEKSFHMEKKFYDEKAFFTEKSINENAKNIYLISEIYFYRKNVCVTNKISIFLKYIFILQKKLFFDHKKYVLKRHCELSNLVLKVSEAGNLWYSLN